MSKLAKRRRQKTYNYSVNRRSIRKREQKKKMRVSDAVVRDGWTGHKSIHYNMESMGLSTNPNKTVEKGKLPCLLPRHDAPLPDNTKVLNSLEEKANAPVEPIHRMSDPDTQYVVYMMDKYGDDYKAMARDRRNYYQDTPKQIKKKIEKFKKVPGLYDTYLHLKDLEASKSDA